MTIPIPEQTLVTKALMSSEESATCPTTSNNDYSNSTMLQVEKSLLVFYLANNLLFTTLLSLSTVYTICKHGSLREQPYLMMTSAFLICELMLLVLYNPVAIALIAGGPEAAPKPICDLQRFLSIFSLPAVQILALMAIERYFYLCRPFLHKRLFTTQSTVILLAVLLTTSCAFLTFRTIFGLHVEYNMVENICYAQGDPAFRMATFILYFCLPALLQLVMFMLIYIEVLKKSRNPPGGQVIRQKSNPRSVWHHVRGGYTVALLCSVYWITIVPYTVIRLACNYTSGDPQDWYWWLRYGIILVTVSPLLDPLVFLYRNRKVRKHWLALFMKRPTQHSIMTKRCSFNNNTSTM